MSGELHLSPRRATPMSCAFCAVKAYFPTTAEFARHLRECHSVKRGGSFVCQYGARGVCPSMPPVDLALADYELHLRRFHSTPATTAIADNSSPASPSRVRLEERFTLQSGIQNLSSVLNDPRKARADTFVFFTRHWGDSFVNKQRAPPSAVLRPVALDYFREYVGAVGKKHRQYLRARRALPPTRRRDAKPLPATTPPSTSSSVAQDYVWSSEKLNEVPTILQRHNFSLSDAAVFEQIFMTPQGSGSDIFDCPSPQKRLVKPSINPVDESSGAAFRPYEPFKEKLECLHDIVESQLNLHLASKSRVFLRAITSQNDLLEQLGDAKEQIHKLRAHLSSLDAAVVQKALRVLVLYRARANLSALHKQLEIIETVRYVQTTVQKFLNKLDYPHALDVIRSAQEVLGENLGGVVCLRHASGQLTEMQNVISKILQEEFVRLVRGDLRKEFATADDVNVSETEYAAVVVGLLRLAETRICQVVTEEITVAVKLLLRQVIRDAISQSDVGVEVDVSTLGDQMRLMSFDQWMELLEKVFTSAMLFCKQANGIAVFLSEMVELAAGRQQAASVAVSLALSETPTTDAPWLGGEAYEALRTGAAAITSHAIMSTHERVKRVLLARAKDAFLERLPTQQYVALARRVEAFIAAGDALAKDAAGQTLSGCLHEQAGKFVARFHDDRKAKLGNILDSELWRPAEVPRLFQQMVDDCVGSGVLRDATASTGDARAHLTVGNERFVVVGTALILLQMMAQYCQLLEQLPSVAPLLLTRLVELLKCFNSRTCQLVLGAGAIQLVGLKTISVKNLALASRCLQLIALYIPVVKREFERHLPPTHSHLIRHFAQVLKDYQDHIQEISNKLLTVMDHHLSSCIMKWEFKGSVPSPSFQQIGKHLKKFHENLLGVLPNEQMQKLFFRVHDNFKLALRAQLLQLDVTPHDAATYGMVCSEFSYYMEVLRSLPTCAALGDTLTDVLSTRT